MKMLTPFVTAVFAAIFVSAAVLVPAHAQQDDGDVVHIVPIGDSITQGGSGKQSPKPEEYTYRYPLAKMLKDADVDFNYVGSRNKGLHSGFQWPDLDGEPFDTDHEGMYGAKTAKVRDHLKTAMDNWDAPADIALIHLGTNDQKAIPGTTYKERVQDPLRQIIEMLRDENPEVVVLLGHLNFSGGTAKREIRPLVEELAREMNTEQSPVVTVAHYEGFHANPNHPETDTYDWAHPNPRGQEKMARAWFEAMKPYLPDQS